MSAREDVNEAIATAVADGDDIDIYEALVNHFDWIDEDQARAMISAATDAAIAALAPHQAAEIAAAVAKREAEIVAWLRAQATCGCGRVDCIADNYPLGYADAIERGDRERSE